MAAVLVLTTVESKAAAEALATLLVKNKLAACVNIIGPIQSIYQWQGKIENEIEFKLFIKSIDSNWPKIQSFIKENHSYSTPEISKIMISDMDADYQQWLVDGCLG